MRPIVASALLIAVGLGRAGAQEPPPSVTIVHATPKAVADAMGEIMKPQKFKVVKASKKRIVLSQDRGNVAQATGTVVKVRLEMGFRLDSLADSLKVTATDETFYADAGPMGEQQREQKVDKDRQNFMTLLERVKAKLGTPPTDSAAAKP